MSWSWRHGGMKACTAVLVLVVSGCGRQGEEAQPESADSELVPTADPAAEVPAGDAADSAPTSGGGMRAELEALGGTDVTGTVRLRPGQEGTTVAVEIHGANSGLPYVAELVGGSCQSQGAVIAELGRITAGEGGDGEFHQVVDPGLLGSNRPNRAVRVRGADSTAIVACGNLGGVTP